MDIQPPRKEISEYHEYDFGGWCEETAEQQRLIMEDDQYPTVADKKRAIEQLVTEANGLLDEQQLIGADAMFTEGGTLPSIENNRVVHDNVTFPITGEYCGLFVMGEVFGGGVDEFLPQLTRPRIVHRLLTDSVTDYGVDYSLSYALYATIPIEAAPPELITGNNPAYLPNRAWLESLTDQINKVDGQYNFQEIQSIFHTIISDESSEIPAQLKMDWFIDYMNTKTHMPGRPLNVWSKSMVIYPKGDEAQPQYRVSAGEDPDLIQGKCLGFGVIDRFKRITQHGVDRIASFEGQPDIALILAADFGGETIVKMPLSTISRAGMPYETQDDIR